MAILASHYRHVTQIHLSEQLDFALGRGGVVYLIPAGKLNYRGEDPLSAAKRELREETGAVAKKFVDLGDLVPSPAVLSEKIKTYLAEDISFTERELDEDEFLDVEMIPLEELYQMVMRGEIADAKTQVAVLKVWNLKTHPAGLLR